MTLSDAAVHANLVLGTLAGQAAIAHIVNTFPTPKNPYGAWLLGSIQFLVGQRVAAANTVKGLDSVVTSVSKQP